MSVVCRSTIALLLLIWGGLNSPMLTKAENVAVACMLTFDTGSAGVCAKHAIPQLTETDVVDAVTAYNSYTDACCHHPNPDYVARQFHIRTPIQIKEMPSQCVTDKWNMDDSSDRVSCSGDVQHNLYDACRVLFGLNQDTDTLVFVFNIPSNACQAAALGGNGMILFNSKMRREYLVGTLIHEMGHNFHIQHSNTSSEEYGDNSDPMGSGDKSTCYNAVNSNFLGWSTSLAPPLTPSQQTKNVWMPFAVPALAKQNVFANHLIISSNDNLALAFLSFRDGILVGQTYYDQTSTKVNMSNLMGRKVSAFRKISVHYVKAWSGVKFPTGRATYNAPDWSDMYYRKSLMVDTIDVRTTWSSGPFFGASAAYKHAPLAGPFAVSFDSYDSTNNVANIRICFLDSESDIASKACKSQSNIIEPFNPSPIQIQVNRNMYGIRWLSS